MSKASRLNDSACVLYRVSATGKQAAVLSIHLCANEPETDLGFARHTMEIAKRHYLLEVYPGTWTVHVQVRIVVFAQTRSDRCFHRDFYRCRSRYLLVSLSVGRTAA